MISIEEHAKETAQTICERHVEHDSKEVCAEVAEIIAQAMRERE